MISFERESPKSFWQTKIKGKISPQDWCYLYLIAALEATTQKILSFWQMLITNSQRLMFFLVLGHSYGGARRCLTNAIFGIKITGKKFCLKLTMSSLGNKN